MNDEIVNIYFKALLLAAGSDDKFLELAAALHFLQEAAPEHFKTLLDLPRLGKRKGYYLVLVHKAFGQFAKDEAVRIRLNTIGWTKLTVIAGHVAADNLEELLGLAEQHTVENFKAIMLGEEPLLDGKIVVLRFTSAQYAVFKKAILKRGAIQSGDGIAGKERALTKALLKKSK